MHKYRHKKLPTSFSDMFKDATNTNNRHSDYNYDTLPATKKIFRKFPPQTSDF